MPTRTINLKMVLGKKENTLELRQALWTTHREINNAVKKIEHILLLCRGASYRTLNDEGEVIEIPESHVKEQALKMAREAQKKNGEAPVGSDEEVLNMLRKMYVQIVPSSELDDKGKPQTGDAQNSNAWVSPLMDKESEGGLSVFEKILDPSPQWISLKEQNNPRWDFESNQWLNTTDGKRLQNTQGRPPSWVDKLRKNQPWQDAFIEDQKKKKKEIEDGNAPVIKELKKLALIPLLQPNIKRAIEPDSMGVSVWDRLAMRLAVAHFLSWESWNYSTKKAHDEAKQKRDELKQEYIKYDVLFKKLQKYENTRHKKLKEVAMADDDRPYKIRGRTIRSWTFVLDKWRKLGDTVEKRKEILVKLQTKLRGKFGDPDLFFWIAKEGKEDLWRQEDILTLFVKLNLAEGLLEKRKSYSLMTFADARVHPRWAMYEAPGGSNLRKYKLMDKNGLKLVCPLLYRSETESLDEKDFEIGLAPSDQLSNLEIIKNGKKIRLKYQSAFQDFEGVPGGAEILFDRSYMENYERSNEYFAEGMIGSVHFKLTIDVASKAPEKWLDGNGKIAIPPEVHHFNTALSNKSKHLGKLSPGLRVLSVDLGLRTFASCSVFELVEGKPEKGLFFPAEDERKEDDPRKLWARHERSFKLTLPGETPTTQEKEIRKTTWKENRSIRRDIGQLKQILRLGQVEDHEKIIEGIKALRESFNPATTDSALVPGDLDGLDDETFHATPELWKQRCQEIFYKAEEKVSERFRHWRKRTKARSNSWADWKERRGYHGGKSIWMIEYLDDVRKLIISWNLRGRSYGEVNRQDKKFYGTVASQLLRHINNLKEDRTKSGADLIIQSARGYVPRQNGVGWEKKYEPCRTILFEDLARYRFKIDRPRRENSQLMKWNHREIVTETTMQAEIYGINIQTTAAGFSSRYLASGGAPGVRCRHLTKDDFDGGLPKSFVVNELAWMLGYPNKKDFNEKQEALCKKITPGILVPWSGGELFVSLKCDEKVNERSFQVIHADINAAQNLQRRFWGRCGEAYRITCKKEKAGDESFILENAPGVRLLGALQRLENGDKTFSLRKRPGCEYFYEMIESGSKKLKAIKGEKSEVESEYEQQMIDEDIVDTSVDRETFFRDPSGVFFDSKYWIPSKHYWSEVRKRIWEAMKKPVSGFNGEDDVSF